MIKQDTMKSVDVLVAVTLAAEDRVRSATYAQMGEVLGLSPSAVFGAIRRLQHSGLVRPGTRIPNKRALRDFLVHGARYAFPPTIGRAVRGIPTAHAGPVLRAQFDADTPMVWPDIKGLVHGTGLAPLHPKARELPSGAPEAYAVMTLIDAIRAGDARERNAAVIELDKRLGTTNTNG